MRKLAAIMFTDIVGFTAQMGEEEHKALQLLQKNRELLKPIINQFDGDWLKEMGDGTLSCFASAVEAVNCALAIQRVLKDDPDLKLRIGIHVGDVVFEHGDVFGDGVNIASRIEPLAEAGGVCVSEQVYDAIRNKPGIAAILQGDKNLKGVDHPVTVYAVMDMRASMAKKARPGWWTWATAAAIVAVALVIFVSQMASVKNDAPDSGFADAKSIAVLPFTPFTISEENQSFADGVHDDILTQLSKINDLKVISRTSVVQYKNTTKTMQQIAGELNVVHILEGSVRRAGNQIRIVAQLINAVNDHHVWSETYDRDYTDIFAIQSDVAIKIAAALKLSLAPAEKKYIEEKPTKNMEAYDYYLKGKHFWDTKMTRAGNMKAADMLEMAAVLDPNFTLALAAASVTHSVLYGYIEWDHTPERKAMAKIALDKAIALDPDHPRVHYAKAFYQSECIGDLSTALSELEIASTGEPNNQEIAQVLGTIYWKLGNWKKAEGNILKAYELDPAGSNSAGMVGFYFKRQRQFEKAKHYNNLAIQLDPEQYEHYIGQAFNYIAGGGDLKKALSILEEAEMNVSDPEQLSAAQFRTEIYSRDYSKALQYAKEYKKYNEGSLILGSAYNFLGDDSAAQTEFSNMRIFYEKKVEDDPEFAQFHSNLGQVYAYLGLKDEAVLAGKRGTALLPVSKNHLNGAERVEDLAKIYVLTGEYGLALDKIEYLLSIPGDLTVWNLRLDPVYDPLRDNPRFQALLEKYQE